MYVPKLASLKTFNSFEVKSVNCPCPSVKNEIEARKLGYWKYIPCGPSMMDYLDTRLGWCLEVSVGFSDNPSLTDHTVGLLNNFSTLKEKNVCIV